MQCLWWGLDISIHRYALCVRSLLKIAECFKSLNELLLFGLAFPPPSKCWNMDWILLVQNIQTFFVYWTRQIACKKCRQVKGLVLIMCRASMIVKHRQPVPCRCSSVTPASDIYLKGVSKEQSLEVLSLVSVRGFSLPGEHPERVVLPFYSESPD